MVGSKGYVTGYIVLIGLQRTLGSLEHFIAACSMSSELAASVLRFALADVKRSGGRVTDAHGQMLAALEPSELQLLQAASELVAKRAVAQVVAMPSRRTFFRVTSLNRFRSHGDGDGDGHDRGSDRRMEGPAASQSFVSQPFDAAMMSENQPNYYNCFDHYCSCSHFHSTSVKSPVAMVGPSRCSVATKSIGSLEFVWCTDRSLLDALQCKHMVAVLLADATQQLETMTIGDADFAKMLCPPATGGSDHAAWSH